MSRVYRGAMTRRDFLCSFVAASAAAVIPPVSACATPPVTGPEAVAGATPGDLQRSNTDFDAPLTCFRRGGAQPEG